tara:strand:+ start:3294 stop:3470 length:177 start_codon:yes stop_codon:yes gene_type:complete
MTAANSKRLYEHYVDIGYTEAAEDMLKKHPEFAEKPKEVEEVEDKPKETKETKKNGKK